MNNLLIEKLPGFREICDRTSVEIEQLVGLPVSIKISVKVKEITFHQLSFIVSKVCEVSWESIKGPTKKGMIIVARQLYCWFAHHVQKKTLTDIGKDINRDHTTVITSLARVQNMIDTDDELYMIYYNQIWEAIKRIYNETKTNP